MARHEHLPIYKAALDMTVHLDRLLVGFSRHHQHTLGTALRQGRCARWVCFCWAAWTAWLHSRPWTR